VFFDDGSATERVEVEYPLGHPRRRNEALPRLKEKFLANVAKRFSNRQCRMILQVFDNADRLENLAVDQVMALFALGHVSNVPRASQVRECL